MTRRDARASRVRSSAVSAPVFGEYMWLFDKLVWIVVFHWEVATTCHIKAGGLP